MSQSNNQGRKAVALQYENGSPAPVVVASGMGYMAEKIVEVATENGVPVYEDTSLATMLAQLKLGQPIPESLYQFIVDIYVYFLQFDPENPKKNLSNEIKEIKDDAAEQIDEIDEIKEGES